MEYIVVIVIVIVIAFCFFSLNHIRAEIPASLNITNENTPPFFIVPIPNQVWATGTNNTDAFDLDDYFLDDQNDSLNYTVDSVSNITIVINASNVVSFYPDYSFTGLRYVRFYAYDGSLTGASNNVTLNVTSDIEAPKWSSMSKNKVTIFQNDFINFSAAWTDNINLNSHIFSIDQGAGWVNSSLADFSGRSNISRTRVQISAGSSTTVYWRFFAFDDAGNINATDIANFTVSSPPSPPTPPSTGSGGSGSGGGTGGEAASASTANNIFRTDDFTLDPPEFKVDLKQGESLTKFLKINNFGRSPIFKLYLQQDTPIVSLEKLAINITTGQSGVVSFDIDAPKTIAPDLYFAKIIVTSPTQNKTVPIAIEINQFDIDFKIDVLVTDEEVLPGEKVHANITFTNLEDRDERNITFYYAIKDWNGETYDFAQQEHLLNSKVLLNVNLTVPLSAQIGEYFFYARASTENKTAVDTQIFFVGDRFSVFGLIRYYFPFILAVIILITCAYYMSKYRKNKKKARLLKLYVLVNNLRQLMEENKLDQAIEVYLKIKEFYKESLSQTAIDNKEQLKKEINILIKEFPESKTKIVQEKSQSSTANADARKDDTVKDKPAQSEEKVSDIEEKEKAEKKEKKKEKAKEKEEKKEEETNDVKVDDKKDKQEGEKEDASKKA